jgi:FtsP/CotA-like multicopper oxidase with cupredoxin domain
LRTGGEFYLPVDETIAGGGPILDKAGNQIFAKDSQGNPTTIPIKMGQNRAAIHWHGGDSPWISDGTPHQWFAPAGDISYTLNDGVHPNGMGKGDSAANVPDMPDPGPGSYTLYFPNNLSGRLMMYHDHTSGLTKLNAYTGMAAGYVIYDPVELTLAANAIGTTLDKKLNAPGNALDQAPIGLLDAVGIPLVIQDKTFVPKNIGDPVSNPFAHLPDGTPASQDTKWDLNHWGQPGDLYFPHVYETNQDPNSADGTNPVGRWDWGPWFWPVFPAQMSLPTGEYGHVTATPEAFLDTSIVNGQAYPSLTVDPRTYRFRILSIGNDRTLNLGLYQAVDANGLVCDANAPATVNTLAIPAGVSKTSTPALAPTVDARQGPPAACTEVRMVPAVPTPGFPATWPTDGRVGGVPDPATAGPDIVQIGNEAGLLPALAILKSQPVNYETNVRSITVFNIKEHDLLLAGGERADVLIDFSKYAGQTLIIYNDAPAPMPGLDPRIDYTTNGGDKVDAGGAFNTQPGYGPNTRTVMQIKVNNTTPAAPLDTVKLAAALPAAYAQTQPQPLIPETVYNAPFGASFVNNYAAIGTGSGALNSGLFTFNVPSYVDPADGLTKTTKSIPVINKAIQELFDPIYGRMNSTLAVELPFSTATIATTIPLAYVDVPVERLDAIKEGEVQIWKVTHNGVDGHPVHFHMVNVQVINRVAWDGTIRPPEDNELGWKETLRMNPLEDVYVAVKAVKPVTPFGLPRSTRLLDPSQAADSTLGFTQIDPTTGQAPRFQSFVKDGAAGGVNTDLPVAQYANKITDFDNEYVWHCHILGHEEQDFMRPFIFHPTVVVPDAPAMVAVSGSTVTWTDTTPFGGQDAQGIPTAGKNAAHPEPTASPKNEIGFQVLESTGTAGAPYAVVATVPANTTRWDGAKTGASYQVIAFNDAGRSLPGQSSTTTTAASNLTGTAAAPVYTSTAGTAPAAVGGPSGLTQTLNADGTVTLTWTAVAGATGYTINGTAVAAICSTDALSGVTTCSATVTPVAGINAYAVVAQTLSGSTAAATTSVFSGIAKPPVALTASQGNQNNGSPRGSITLTWANNPLNVNNVTGLTLTWTLAGSTVPTGIQTFAPGVTGATIVNLQRDKKYDFTLVAKSKAGNSTTASRQGLSSP